MTASVSRIFSLALALVFVFMTNVSIWDEHSNWITKEIAQHVEPHAYHDLQASLHDDELVTEVSLIDSHAVEHELLHAASHLQLFLDEELAAIRFPQAQFTKHRFFDVKVVLISIEPPFRPPSIAV